MSRSIGEDLGLNSADDPLNLNLARRDLGRR